jgi:membrane-bound metal-dependent hydrolase YbcI (DUF457 family)
MAVLLSLAVAQFRYTKPMTGMSHLTLGVAFSALGVMVFFPELESLVWAPICLGGVAALLPDIDAPNSLLQQTIFQSSRAPITDGMFSKQQRHSVTGSLGYAMARIVELSLRSIIKVLFDALKVYVGHRGPTHTLLVWVVLSGIVSGIVWWIELSWAFALAFGIGYVSHILADATTRSGVKMLEPFSGQTVHLLPESLRIRTGTPVEGLLVAVIVAGILVVLSLLTGTTWELPTAGQVLAI